MTRVHRSWVYILASRKNGTLYVGVTTDLRRRVWQHKAKIVDGFSKQHGVVVLVHCEQFSVLKHAITREKEIKGWRRIRKIVLIEAGNPDWMTWPPAGSSSPWILRYAQDDGSGGWACGGRT